MSRGAESGERTPAQGRWLAAGAMAGLVALAGGVFLLYPRQSPQHARVAAADCGLVRCSANLPATGSASPVADGTPTPAKATPRASATASTVATRRSASPAKSAPAISAPASTRLPAPRPAAPAPPPGPAVTVSFAVDQTGGDWHGQRFAGHFTLVNHTASAISGWTLQAGLSQARVEWVSTSGSGQPPYWDWQKTGGGLVISGAPGEAIPAHGSTVFYVFGQGGNTGLASCSFNGSSC